MVDAYKLCLAMDKVAADYHAKAKAAGKDVKPATETPACAGPRRICLHATRGRFGTCARTRRRRFGPARRCVQDLTPNRHTAHGHRRAHRPPTCDLTRLG